MSIFDKVDDDLFFTCSLIEKISRDTGFSVKEITEYVGVEGIRQIHFDAPVLHCLVPEQAAGETMEFYGIPEKASENKRSLPANFPYRIPSFFEIGRVYVNLITDIADDRDPCVVAYEVLTSWITDEISAFESSVYWSPRNYIECCYREGEIV